MGLCVARFPYCETRYIEGLKASTPTCYLNSFYLVVGNYQETGATLRRVSCRISFIGEPVLAGVKDTTESAIDIRHGEWAYFELGRIISENPMGAVRGKYTVPAEDAPVYEHNVPNGHIGFEVRRHTGMKGYMLGHIPGHSSVFEIATIVSADDVPSKHAILRVAVADTKSPITFADAGLSQRG